jgi:Rod binding domain-containing protein
MGQLPPPTPKFSAGADILSTANNVRDARNLQEAAVGFETTFLSILLKEMRQTLEPGTMFGNDPSDVFGGLFDTFMSQYLGQTGSLGIAKLVKQQLQAYLANGPRTPASPPTL